MPSDDQNQEAPYEPKYKGFDAERTKRAAATAERSREAGSVKGDDYNREYVDDGPAEAARRRGESKEEAEARVEDANNQ